jgi:putative ABC transport system substrate-binding protein
MLALLGAPFCVEAQQTRLYRIGVVLQGGPYSAAIEGLRDGLRELGLEEGRQFRLDVRDVKGDLRQVAAAARRLEEQRVDLIYAIATSVTLEAKRATNAVPIVFYVGTDPVAVGLVESIRKPGGFYSPDNPVARQSVTVARDAARQLKVELVERAVVSVEALLTSLHALRPGEVDALLFVSDAMVNSQEELILDTAKAKKLPTMLPYSASVPKAALASYGESYYTLGRLSAKHVQRVLLGAEPGNLPVEQTDRIHFVINLKTAKALGLMIPSSVLVRADQVVE